MIPGFGESSVTKSNFRVPADSEFDSSGQFTVDALQKVGGGKFRRIAQESRQPQAMPATPVQRITEASTPTTIAPTPGDQTGSAPAPMQDSGRGIQSFGEFRQEAPGSISSTGKRRTRTRGSTPMPEQGPKEPDFMDKAKNTVVRTGREIKDFYTNPARSRGRRISYGVGGGLGALATILNLRDTDSEQEEQV